MNDGKYQTTDSFVHVYNILLPSAHPGTVIVPKGVTSSLPSYVAKPFMTFKRGFTLSQTLPLTVVGGTEAALSGKDFRKTRVPTVEFAGGAKR